MKRSLFILLGLISFTICSCSMMVSDFKGLAKTCDYDVEFFEQNIENNEYSKIAEKTIHRESAHPDKEETPEAETGFIFDHKIIDKANGNYFVRFYYSRKVVKVTFNPGQDALWDNEAKPKQIEGKYGAPIVVPSTDGLIRTDYKFAGWDSETTPQTGFVFPAEDVTYNALWTKVNSKYTINYFKEKANSEGYDECFMSETESGEIGLETAVEVSEVMEGFVLKTPIEQKIILDDDSTEVNVYFNRKIVTFTFDAKEGEWAGEKTKTVSGKFDSAVTAPEDPVRASYKFIGWAPEKEGTILESEVVEIDSKFPVQDKKYVAVWALAQNTTDYKVEHYLETVEAGHKYGEEPVKVEEKSGTIGQLTAAVYLNEYLEAGYIGTCDIEQQEIKFDELTLTGTTVVKLYYNRVNVTLTFDADGGSWTGVEGSNKLVEGQFGKDVEEIKTPVKTDFAFLGWYEVIEGQDAPDAGSEAPAKFPPTNKTYKALWKTTLTNYAVEHWFEKENIADASELTEANYEKVGDSQTLAGVIGANTQATAKEEAGFEAQAITQLPILEDGTTVVKAYYKRKLVTVSYDLNGGLWATGTEQEKLVSRTESKKFGSTLEGPGSEGTDYARENFDQDTENPWTPAIPEKMPAEAQTFVANWTIKKASYTVKYLFQTIADEDVYEENAVLAPQETVKNVEAGSTTDAGSKIKSIEGFTAPASGDIENKIVAEDDSTIVELKYTRNTTTATFFTQGGTWTSGAKNGTTDALVLSGKYESVLDGSVLTQLSKESSNPHLIYKLDGWSLTEDGEVTSVVTDFGASNLSYYAKWSVDSAEYKVVYAKEDAFTGNYVVDNELTKTGFIEKAGKVMKLGDLPPQTVPAAIAGYLDPVMEDTEIKADGSTVLTVKYERASVTLTFDVTTNGGKWDDADAGETGTRTGKIGSAITPAVPDPVKNNFEFAGWNDEKVATPTVYPAANTTYTAKYGAQLKEYTVKYRFQPTSLSTNKDDYEAMEGDAFKDVTKKDEFGVAASPDELQVVPAGFSYDSKTTPIIAESGTVAYVYYNRIQVTVNFAPNGGKWKSDSSTEAKSKTGYFGCAIDSYAASDLERKDFTFVEWKNLPAVYPAATETYDAVWNQTSTKYEVRHLFEQTSGTVNAEGCYPYSTEEGEYGSQTIEGAAFPGFSNATSYTRDGFTPKAIEQVELKADGTSVVNVYYKRNIITYTFDANGGTWTTVTGTVSGKYGTALTVPSSTNLSKSDGEKGSYYFAGWSESVNGTEATPDSTFGLVNKTYYARWNSKVGGNLINPLAEDIELQVSVSEGSVTSQVTVPYAGSWTYTWYVDGSKVSQTTASFTKNDLTKGNHSYRIIAVDSDGLSFTKSASIKIN